MSINVSARLARGCSPLIKNTLRRPTIILRRTNQHAKRTIATHSAGFYESAVSVIRSNIDVSSSEFKQNAEDMAGLVKDLDVLHEKIKLGGPEKARIKHKERKKMFVRE